MLKKYFSKKYFVIAFVLWVFSVLPGQLPADSHSVILTGVPVYPQEAFTWCGPAIAQMVIAGYPTPPGGCTELQEDIWLEILSHKVESVWDTDPEGLEKAMESLCPPTGSWVVHARTNSADLIYKIAYYMTTNNYPVALLLNTDAHNSNVPIHKEHWVAVTGIVTDKDPTAYSSVNLEAILIHDPAHSDMGYPTVHRYLLAGTFGTLFKDVDKPASSYHGKYVAVIEPPTVTGTVVIPVEVLEGRVIKSQAALEYAAKWLEKYKIYELEKYKYLKNAKPLEPMLVDEKYGGYYLIPYTSAERSNPVQGAVLINAYKGNLKEVGGFKPVKHIPEKEAVQTALKYLNIKGAKEIKAELVTKIKGQTFSKYFPCWKITLDGKVVHVDQKGNIFSTVLPKEERKPPYLGRYKWSASIHGGYTFPVTDFGSRYDGSFMFAVDLDYHFTSQLSAVAFAGFNHFKAAVSSVTDTHWWNFSANLKWEFTTNPLRPYVNGGFGIYVPKTGSTKYGFNLGLGIDRTIAANLIIEAGVDYHHILTNQEDPEFYTAHVGLIFCF